MSRYRVGIHIVPREGILDPQGRTVANALHQLGFEGVSDARIGRHVMLDVDAGSEREATDSVRAMCERLLANPVTEDFEIATVRPL